jgi:hypothetical protein
MKTLKRVLILFVFAVGCLVLVITTGGIIMDKAIDAVSAAMLVISILLICITGRFLSKENVEDKHPDKTIVFTGEDWFFLVISGALTVVFLVDAIFANPYSFLWVMVFLICLVSLINKYKKAKR